MNIENITPRQRLERKIFRRKELSRMKHDYSTELLVVCLSAGTLLVSCLVLINSIITKGV